VEDIARLSLTPYDTQRADVALSPFSETIP